MTQDAQTIINRKNRERAAFFAATEPKKDGAVQRMDGRWLAYQRGLPLMNADFSNRSFATRLGAERALSGHWAD